MKPSGDNFANDIALVRNRIQFQHFTFLAINWLTWHLWSKILSLILINIITEELWLSEHNHCVCGRLVVYLLYTASAMKNLSFV